MADKTGTTIKANCNACGPYRNHFVIKAVHKSYTEDEDGIDGGENYMLLKCGGCDGISLRHDSWNDYDIDPETGPEVVTVYYPPAISRKEPWWVSGFLSPFYFDQQNPIIRLLKEIYSALHNNSIALATMGIRALIEHIMIDCVGDKGSIGENVKAFLAEGHIAPRSETLFRDSLLEFGHAAMHRAHFPKASELATLLDITESLIETIYIHPHRAEGLTPPPSRVKKGKTIK